MLSPSCVNGDFSQSYIIMYEYFNLMPKIKKIPKNPELSFNGQPNMFFGMFISYTCELHLKLDILNPLNIVLLSNGLKNEFFALQPFFSKFPNFENFE